VPGASRPRRSPLAEDEDEGGVSGATSPRHGALQRLIKLKEKIFFGQVRLQRVPPEEISRLMGAMVNDTKINVPLKGSDFPNLNLAIQRELNLKRVTKLRAHARALGLSRQMTLINANPDGWRDLPFDKLTHHQILALAGLIANHRGEIQKGLINTGDKFPGCTCLATEGPNQSTLFHRALHCPKWHGRSTVTELTNLIGRHADSSLRLKQALSGELGAPRQRTALHCLGKLVFGSTPP